jgi:branched-chain amino acid transport system permease protein
MVSRPSTTALLVLAALLVLFLALPFLAGSSYGLKLATRLVITCLFVVSLDVLMGLAGLVSFGHAAFFGVGAYAVYFVSGAEGTNPFVALGAGMGLAAVTAAVIGAFAVLTRGFYFIMVTLAAGQMMFSLFHDTDIAKGSDGAYIDVKPVLSLAGHDIVDFTNRRVFFYVCIALLALIVVALYRFARTPWGRLVQAVRINEPRLSALGFDTYRIKLATFVLSASVAGLAGALYACIDGFVTPDLLGWHQSGLAIMMVVLGGAGTLFGPILGALAYVCLEELLKTASLVGPVVADHWRLGTGATLILAVLLSPGGLFAFLGRSVVAKPLLANSASHVSHRTPAKMRLATHSLSRHFGGLRAVSDVTIEFLPGLVHAIIGPNGAGKTTFINCLSGAIRPSEGAVLLDGRPIGGLAPFRVARLGIGRSFQRTNVFPSLSAAENCRLAARAGDPRHADAHVADALARTGLFARANDLASALSNGEQRQLEIAMLIAADREILILDEPLAGMGAEETARVVALLRALRATHTIILIEHDMDAVFAVADTLTVLVQGRMIAHGDPAVVRRDPTVIDAYLGRSDARVVA